MIVTIAFTATDGNRDALIAELLRIIPDTRAFDGCNSITFTESQKQAGDLVLIEDWDSHDRYNAYKTWRRESGTSVLGSNLVDESSVVTEYFDLLGD